MRKTNSIRLFFVLGAVVCCAAYSGGYYFMQNRPRPEPLQAEQGTEEERQESIESGSIVLPYEFVLKEVDGFVAVYCADGETLYDNTAIRVEHLPWKLQQEIREGKEITSEMELYNFLQSYSS